MWITPPPELGLGDGWVCRYARRHERDAVVLVYERAGRTILVEGPDWRVSEAADDPALPGLRAALEAGAQIVRYHPHLRCTVRLGERFGKLLSDASGPALLAAQRVLWAHRDELGFAVAEPLAYDEPTRTLWLAALAGREPELTPPLAARMGAALATLAASRVVPPGGAAGRGTAGAAQTGGAGPGGAGRGGAGAHGEAAPARRTAREAGDALIARIPSLRGEVEALLDRIATLHAAAPDCALRPVHGAPHPTAWLLDGPRLGLLDFDRLALGHPEADVAAFQAAAGLEAVASAFARGFGALDARRLEAYRLERGLAKALRATYDLRPDAHERAARRLRRAAGAPPRATGSSSTG